MVIIGAFMSLDGVMQAPGGPEEGTAAASSWLPMGRTPAQSRRTVRTVRSEHTRIHKISTVANNTVDPLNTRCGEGFCKLIGNAFGHRLA